MQRGSGQIDNERNADIDDGGDVAEGSLAGEPTPIHIQDSGSVGESVSAGSGREWKGYATRLATAKRTITEEDLDTDQIDSREANIRSRKLDAYNLQAAEEGGVTHEENNYHYCPCVFLFCRERRRDLHLYR